MWTLAWWWMLAALPLPWIVRRLVPAEPLVERALATARAFQPVPSDSLLAARRLLDSAGAQSLDAQLDAEKRAMCQAAGTASFRAAVAAFLRPR